VKIGIGAGRKTIIGNKKDDDRSGMGTEITGTVRSLSIARSRILNYPLLEIALNAMVMIDMIDPIGAIMMMIGSLMGRLGGERQFMIGLGADSV